MLASDLINPQFVGARNPDELLSVEFHWQPVKTMFGKPALEEDGTPKRTIFVKIERPGETSSIVDTPMREEHKKRFPRQWLAFQMAEGIESGNPDVPGWKIEEWKELDPNTLRDLKYMRFHTVEQIAGASDAQIQRMGMGAAGLRVKARAALAGRMDEGVKAEIASRDKKIADLEAKLDRLLAAVESKATPAVAPATVAPVQVTDDRAALSLQYEDRFGKPPHHRKTIETIKAELEAV